jgi:hypothetical protein
MRAISEHRPDFSSRIPLLFYLLALLLCISEASAAGLSVEHTLEVEIYPNEKKLIAIDTMKIEPNGNEMLSFQLSENVHDITIAVDGKERGFGRRGKLLQIPLNSNEKNQTCQIAIRYSGIFDDPVPQRPLNMDNPGFGVSASITAIGAFLLAGSFWYPELLDSRAVYRLKVRAPAGMIAVTAGRSMARTTANGHTVSEWQILYPIEGISLSVAPFIVKEKQVGRITVATYFLSDDPNLSAAYIAASEKYIKLYADLFGPYPFDKFAVVENFFPTGFGFPSYTLLGSTVLRLPFIIHTSLGHEIAHCWWGNGVYVAYDQGNWSEALTTYVADYFYKERRSQSAARDYRLQILRNYATLVKPQNDFALNQFRARHDPITKTIGYDKGAMVFHMLRKLLGEEVFWGSLQDLYRKRLFQKTSWNHLQKAFENRAQRSLQWFFEQWVDQKGAPRFYLDNVRVGRQAGRYKIEGEIIQHNPYFNFDLNLLLESRRKKISKTIAVKYRSTPFEIISDTAPLKLSLDPGSDTMRRLYEIEVPPSINSLKSSESVLCLLSENLDPEKAQIAESLVRSLGIKRYELVPEHTASPSQLKSHDILMIGLPKRKELARHLPPRFIIQDRAFSLDGNLFHQPSDSFFGVFAHPSEKSRIAALFWPPASEYASMVVRKIAHYGKYSYLVFQKGQNQAKGIWTVESSPLVFHWNQ